MTLAANLRELRRAYSLIDSSYLARCHNRWQDPRLLLYSILLIGLEAVRISWRVVVELVRCLGCPNPTEGHYNPRSLYV